MGTALVPVSYTHLDVYKRQVYMNFYIALPYSEVDQKPPPRVIASFRTLVFHNKESKQFCCRLLSHFLNRFHVLKV